MRLGKILKITSAGIAGILLLGGIAILGYLRLQPRPSPHPAPAETRDGRWQQDVEYLAQELPRLHADAFHTTPRAEFEATVAKLIEEIPELADHEVHVRIAEIVAAVGDAHTSMEASVRDSPRFPVWFLWFSDGLFVTHTTEEYRRLAHATVLGIENVNIREALDLVGAVISHENEVGLRGGGQGYLRNADVLHALGIIPERDSASFTFRTAEGDTTTVRLPARQIRGDEWVAPPSDPPLYRQRRSEPFWFELIDGGRTLYFKYNNCTNPWGFWRFSRRIRRALKEREIQRMVVDYRGNGGGNSLQFTYLLLGGIKKSRLNERGRLYGIIDAGTFSSATLNAAELRKETAALLLGEPSSGQPTGYGEVRQFTLPNSGLTVWYSSKYFEPDPEMGGGSSLEPDVRIGRSSADYFAGLDPVLDSILAWPLTSPSASSRSNQVQKP